MTETLALLLALGAGGVLGGLFFGALWWTVRQIVSSRRPALWLFGSLFLRMSIALAGFWFVSAGHWDRLLACVLGFAIARFIVTRLSEPPVEHYSSPAKEAGHAPQS